jgi:hypothetical protein
MHCEILAHTINTEHVRARLELCAVGANDIVTTAHSALVLTIVKGALTSTLIRIVEISVKRHGRAIGVNLIK